MEYEKKTAVVFIIIFLYKNIIYNIKHAKSRELFLQETKG
jgi:hypothetical protein